MKRGLIALALALVFASTPGSATAAKPPDGWNHTHYFEFSELSLGTVNPDPSATYPDCQWQGTRYVTNVSPPDFLPFNCVNAAYVWAPVCKPGAQTVEFKKRIWLPGAASEFQASLVSVKDGTLVSMEIVVNGSRVLRATTSVHKKGLKAEGDAFREGWNTIAVRATKKKGGPCNQFAPDVGVYAHLHAKFAADIAVVIARKAFGTFVVPLSVINKGPSTAPEVSVSFAAYTTRLKKSHGFVMLVRRDGGDPLAGCSTSAASTGYKGKSFTGYRTTCLLGELKPGERLNLEVIYNYVAPAGDFFDRWPIIWRADSTEVTDGKYGNNGGDWWQGACRPPKPPQCSAPAG